MLVKVLEGICSKFPSRAEQGKYSNLPSGKRKRQERERNIHDKWEELQHLLLWLFSTYHLKWCNSSRIPSVDLLSLCCIPYSQSKQRLFSGRADKIWTFVTSWQAKWIHFVCKHHITLRFAYLVAVMANSAGSYLGHISLLCFALRLFNDSAALPKISCSPRQFFLTQNKRGGMDLTTLQICKEGTLLSSYLSACHLFIYIIYLFNLSQSNVSIYIIYLSIYISSI